MFQKMTLNVTKILREEVEKNKEDVSISVYDILSSSYFLENIAHPLTLLGNNEELMDTLLDRIWKQFAHYSLDDDFYEMRIQHIRQELSSELQAVDLNKKCLRNETCWSIVEKGARSIVALVNLETDPDAGSYLSHHMSRMFSSESYIPPRERWPYQPFGIENSDELTLVLNQYMMSMTYELSNAKVKNVSLLDLPAFGSMFGSFKKKCTSPSWSIQQNMAIYNQLMSSNNFRWSLYWGDKLHHRECEVLRVLWKEYMKNPKVNDFPPQKKSNNYLNFTGYIKDDMPAFLTAYSASFPNILNTSVWSEVAKRVFSDTDFSEDEVETYGLYDKLIMHCVYQKSLFSHKSDNLEVCADLSPILTSNGICYSFNSIDTLNVWRQELRSTDILDSFSKVFGTLQHESKKFRGIGHSEGMLCLPCKFRTKSKSIFNIIIYQKLIFSL